MARQNSATQISSTRMWRISGVVLLILAVAFVVWNFAGSHAGSGNPNGRDNDASTKARPVDASSHGKLADGSAEIGRNTRSSMKRTGGGTSGEVTQFPLVQRILSDLSLSERDAAMEMAAIARRSDISEAERFEALAHGLNLDFKSLTTVADDASLPVPLAQRYLDELANRNHLPVEQIKGCLGLMNHSNADIRNQAAIELAFLVENESLASSPDALRKAAASRLEVLRTNSPVREQTAPGDTAGIPGLK